MKVYKPLVGIRVLDFTRLIPGPYCTKILSDLGATIIKIEDVKFGDYLDRFSTDLVDGESVFGLYLNKNKKRLKIDFASNDGRAIIKKLISDSKILVESFRPGVMAKLKFGARDVHKINPEIVYASITGYGQHSKFSKKAGHDINFMAVSSLLDNFKGQVPKFQVADFVGGGFFAALMILSALINPNKKRIRLDISMAEAMVYLRQHHLFAKKPIDLGFIEGNLARYQVYETKDKKWVALGCLEDKFWHNFCEAISKPAYKNCGMGFKENQKLMPKLRKLFATKSSLYWKKLGEKYDICLTLVTDKKELIEFGYLSNIFLTCNNKVQNFHEASLFNQGKKQKYSKPGSDNRLILKNLGYSSKEVSGFEKAGVIKN